jgi:UDP-glucose 4-epimerase
MSRFSILLVGAGFLGRAIALKLVGAGHRITVLSPHAQDRSWPDGIAAVSGRQEAPALICSLLADHDAVIHAAWGTTPGSSATRPALEAELGLGPFLAFLESLQRFPHVRLLFLSSGGTVYGNPADLPVPETAPLQPLSCHGAGKAAAELFLGLRAPEKTLILRPSNIYGPGQPLKSGFGVIRHLLHCAAEEMPFQLWGDGRQVRDYLYIDDFVEAVCRLVSRPATAGVFNLGSGRGSSLDELIELVGRVTGRSLRIERRPQRGGDVRAIVLDISRLSEATGWQPTVSLEEGLAVAWRQIQGRR